VATAVRTLIALAALVVAGCASSTGFGGGSSGSTVPHAHPHALDPLAGQEPVYSYASGTPIGDVNAHAPPLSQVRSELKLALVYARKTNATYINPLQYVNHWERTDQGVDATMPVGAPILAPTTIKILAVEPDWYAGQPLVYYELLAGPDAGLVQYVAEEITNIAEPGLTLTQGQTIATFAPQGTGIEFGWSTPSGTTLAVATSGYEEGQVTPAGVAIRKWLNALGANAGPS
jgi:hypothetical protein